MLRSALSSRRALSSQVECLVVQLDCGDDAAPGVGQLFERLRCIFDELHEWAALSAGTVCFDAHAAAYKDCYISEAVEVCACSYDEGATTTYLYRLPEPPRCYAGYCGTAVPLMRTPPPPPSPG